MSGKSKYPDQSRRDVGALARSLNRPLRQITCWKVFWASTSSLRILDTPACVGKVYRLAVGVVFGGLTA